MGIPEARSNLIFSGYCQVGLSLKKDRTSSIRYRGELHEGRHEPLVSEALFDHVQEILTRKSKPKTPTLKPYLYRGVSKPTRGSTMSNTLCRIGVFYDGSYFTYAQHHFYHTRKLGWLDFRAFHTLIETYVRSREQGFFKLQGRIRRLVPGTSQLDPE